MKKTIMILFAVIVALSMSEILSQPAEAQKKANYLMGSTSTVSSQYPPCVAQAEIINRWAPDVQVTVIATGATHENLARMRKGELDLGCTTNPEGAAMSYMGVRKYKTPDKTLRLFLHYLLNITHIIVRADSGVKKLEDLNGKKLHAGGIGFASTYNTEEIFKALGIKPDYFIGGLSDAVAAIKDNRCIGYSKSAGGVGTTDATTMDIMTSTKVKIISFTEEQIKIALKTIPGLYYGFEPAGSIKGMEDQPDIISFVNGLATYGTTRISQEMGYQIIKALVEHYDRIVAAQPASGLYHPVKDTIKYGKDTAEACGLPLHSGVVQYFEEIGEKVPAVSIPPEYKKP